MAIRRDPIVTPRGKVFLDTPTMKAKLEWNPGFGNEWEGRYQDAQKYVDSEVLRLSEKYIPLQTGMLIKSGILGTEIGSGEVSWIAPYARAQYYMKRKPGSETGWLRGPAWFERGKQIWGQEVIKWAKRIAGGNK